MVSKPLFIKRDIWLFAAILAVALAGLVLFAGGAPGGVGQIALDGIVVHTVDLTRDGVFSLPEIPQIRFAVRDGKIAFDASDCPDKTCVRSGYINRPGQIAACLPNRVSVAVVGGPADTGGVDAIAG